MASFDMQMPLATLRALQKTNKAFREEQAQKGGYDSSRPITPPKDSREIRLNKFIVNRMSNFDMRQFIQKNLTKLGDASTREIGVREIQNFILQNQSPEILRMLLSYFGDPVKSSTNVSHETEVILLGFIAGVYKENLVDPIDRPPSLLKSVYRILNIIQVYFHTESETVKMACARAWNEVYCNCMVSMTLREKIALIYEPLESIIIGGADRFAQNTATLCIFELISMLILLQENAIISELQIRIFGIFLKVPKEYLHIIKTIQTLLEFSKFSSYSSRANDLIEKIILMLNKQNLGKKISFVEKVALITCLSILGQKISNNLASFIPMNIIDLQSKLRELSMDRVSKVQVAAQSALKIWDDCFKKASLIEEKKTSQEIPNFNNPEDLLNYRLNEGGNPHNDDSQITENEKYTKPSHNYFSNSRSPDGQKQRPLTPDDHKILSKDLVEMTKGPGWGANARATNYIKKNTGLVGSKGSLNSNPTLKNKNVISHHVVKKDMKDWILKNKKAHPFDKFEFISEQNPSKQNISPDVLTGEYQFDENEDFVAGKGLNSKQRDREFDDFVRKKSRALEKHIQDNDLEDTVLEEDLVYVHDEDLEKDGREDDMENTILYEEKAILPKFEEKTPVRNNEILKTEYDSKSLTPATEIKFNGKKQTKKQDEEEVEFDGMTKIWLRALRRLNEGNINDAFKLILDSGDDIYLIRLLAKTGSVVGKLNPQVAVKVNEQILKIAQSHFVEMLALNFFDESADIGILSKMNSGFQQDLLKTLASMNKDDNACSMASTKLKEKLLATKH